MAISGKFRRKSSGLYAQGFDGYNAVEVVGWLMRMDYPGDIAIEPPKTDRGMTERTVAMRYKGIATTLNPGDIIVKYSDGAFSVITQNQFENLYEEA